MTKTYNGSREHGARVWIDNGGEKIAALRPRFDLRNH
jgi:hypothetical protein